MRSFLSLILVMTFCMCGLANAAKRTLLSAVITTGAGSTLQMPQSPLLAREDFQAYGTTSAGSGACAVKVQASNDGTRWLDLGTITLTLGTASTNDGFSSAAGWPYVRGNIASISGTNAACSLTVSY